MSVSESAKKFHFVLYRTHKTNDTINRRESAETKKKHLLLWELSALRPLHLPPFNGRDNVPVREALFTTSQ